MVEYNFDQGRDRSDTGSIKWLKYGEGVLPLWVADMDFVSPAPVAEALHQRIDHGIFGYTAAPPELYHVIQECLKRLYNWTVQEEEIVFVPGVVTGLNLALMISTEPGEGVMAQPPVYFHLVDDPILRGRVLSDPPLVQKGDTYEIDFHAFERAITPGTKIFLLCNPHNPVGRVFTEEELLKLADICRHYKMVICSDEIHCDLLYSGKRHIPIASLSPEIADNTITLMAPSKTYNLAGLGCAFAIIKNENLRKRWYEWSRGLIPNVNVLGYTAALAAYKDGQEWLDQILAYLEGNRVLLSEYVGKGYLPGVGLSKIEATYLGWLDCRNTAIAGNPFKFFLEKSHVALNDGAEFGKGGEGFVRLNFACPTHTLEEALERMSDSLKKL
jgi:cysteine-S-conjugate beta-lyase